VLDPPLPQRAELGASLDDLCSNDGGQAAAQQIVADEDVVGVVGTSCSGAAVAAVPLITAAGMVIISGGNTSPALTSDLAGNPGPNFRRGLSMTATPTPRAWRRPSRTPSKRPAGL